MKMKNNFYKFTAEADEKKAARLDLFGAVGGGFWEEGFDEATFKNDMSVVGEDQALDIYINSHGGSVFTATAIYNLIARHKGAVTIHVAGLAASAATIITSAPNAKVIMPIGSMMLVHPVRLQAHGMTPEEMHKAAENLEKVRASVVDIYAKKTGQTSEKLLELMAVESYLTPDEAVELGFADEVEKTSAVENSQIGDVVMVNGLEVSAELFKHAPEGFINKADAPNAPAIHNQANKEEKPMTLDKLKAEHPELVDAIRNEALKEGAEKERARIQAIEDLGLTGYDELVMSAKFEKNMTAEQLAVEAWKAEKGKKKAHLADLKADAEDVADVTGKTPGNEGIELNAGKPEAKTREQLIAEEKAQFEAVKNL